MLNLILDLVFGRDVDTILKAFNTAERRLQGLIQREHQKRDQRDVVRAQLKSQIALLDNDDRNSVQVIDRAGRVRERIAQLSA